MPGYVEAFSELGYEITSPRSEVSSAKQDGIAISIWRNELTVNRKPILPPMSFDTRQIPNWDAERKELPGNQKRKEHLRRAISHFSGRVDVILWDGKDGEAWKRGGHWHLTYFDESSGHHRVELIVD